MLKLQLLVCTHNFCYVVNSTRRQGNMAAVHGLQVPGCGLQGEGQ